MSDAYERGTIIKAATVQLGRNDPHSIPVAQRIAQAEDRGFRAGYEEGYTAGALEAGSNLATAGERLREEVLAAIAAHGALVQQHRTADAEQLVELALAVAEWAARRELSTVPEAFFDRLNEMLADRDRRARVEITTSPAMVGRTREWLGDDEIRVVGADDLDEGEARVSIGDTTVFATFADAFARARSVLDTLGAEHSASDGAEHSASDDDESDESDEVELLYDATKGDTW